MYAIIAFIPIIVTIIVMAGFIRRRWYSDKHGI